MADDVTVLALRLRDLLWNLTDAERAELRAQFDQAGRRRGIVNARALALHDVRMVVTDLTRGAQDEG